MSFSFLSWNVEHFQGGAARLARVADHITSQNPDIFGLLEVENVDVLALMQNAFPNYTFGITDGPQTMEILVGWRTTAFEQVIFAQKREFKAFNPSLRPGALLTVRLNGTLYNFLFLHTDSGTTAPDFGNRAEMFENIWKLKKRLDELSGGPGQGRLVVLGDLNTMGLFYPTRAAFNERIAAAFEIKILDREAQKVSMGLLPKDEPVTFNNGNLQSDLDHILASSNLQFTAHGISPTGTPARVRVRGWNQLAGAARDDFITTISDHASLLATIEA